MYLCALGVNQEAFFQNEEPLHYQKMQLEAKLPIMALSTIWKSAHRNMGVRGWGKSPIYPYSYSLAC